MCAKRASKEKNALNAQIEAAKDTKNFDGYMELLARLCELGNPAYLKNTLLEHSEACMLSGGHGFYVNYYACCEACGWSFSYEYRDKTFLEDKPAEQGGGQ
jgi:hypothetical protein